MFFNAGRMGFRHFKMPIPIEPPSGGGSGSFGNGCFGLTNDQKIVFGFDTYCVPDRPAFAYVYDCIGAERCLSGLGNNVNNSILNGSDCLDNTPGQGSGGDNAFWCSCTGGRYQTARCWQKELFDLAGNENGVSTLSCERPPLDPETGVQCNGVDDVEENVIDCTGWPIDSVSTNPTKTQYCDFCTQGESGSDVCGISVPYLGPCICTSSDGGDGYCCPPPGGVGSASHSGCIRCTPASTGLKVTSRTNNVCTDGSGNPVGEYAELSSFIKNWGNGLVGTPTGATGYGTTCFPPTIDQDILDYFDGTVCSTFQDSDNLAVDVSKLAKDGSITSTNQIKPAHFMSVSGHNCAGFRKADGRPASSVYQTFFAYLTNEGGATFCNLYLGGLTDGPCSSPIKLRPDCGCTFNFVGITHEDGSCVNTHDLNDPNRATGVGPCTDYHLRNLSCANGLARFNNYSALANTPEDSNFTYDTPMDEGRYFRRIDNSIIDTCGVNPCSTSNAYDQTDIRITPAGAGFDGTGCKAYIGQLEDYDPGDQDSFGNNTSNDGVSDYRRYYNQYHFHCDANGSLSGFDAGGTAQLVAGISSDRNTRAKEAVNRVGRRSEQYFDLPLSSVGTVRSFFAPWVDEIIHKTATPQISARDMKKSNIDNNPLDGSILSAHPINHLAQGPYPAYSYYSWFYGPMFDSSEVMRPWFSEFDGEYPSGAPAFDDTQPEFRNHSAPYKRYEGQWGPHIFGKFLTHPGFLGTPDDTATNLTNASRGYYDSWGAIRLNNFWKTSSSVFTGGTLSKFTDTLTTKVEAFNNPIQNRKVASAGFSYGWKDEWDSDLDGDNPWPPRHEGSSDSLSQRNYPMLMPLAGATSVAGPLNHNPHGLTAHSALGWCSSVGRQNASYLNPRFTVASNWLWPGGRSEYNDTDYKLILNQATVNTGTLDNGGNGSAYRVSSMDLESADGQQDRIGGVTGQYIEVVKDHVEPKYFLPVEGVDYQEVDPMFVDGTLDGGADSKMISSSNFQFEFGGELSVSPFAPQNRTYGVHHIRFDYISNGYELRSKPHDGYQMMSTYKGYYTQPFWVTNRTGLVSYGTFANGNANDTQFNPHMAMQMAIGRFNNNSPLSSGNSITRFGMFTDAEVASNPNQRFEGMDRFDLDVVIAGDPGNTSEYSGVDPERTVIPSPSLLSYYPLPIIGGWAYAGGGATLGASYSDILKVRGVGCGQGFLWGSHGRDIIWSSGRGKRTRVNKDGTLVTGPTASDRNVDFSSHSAFHTQRLWANSANTTRSKTVDMLTDQIIDRLGSTAGLDFNPEIQCEYDMWKNIRASHCLLDIENPTSSSFGSGIKTIPSSFVGCTAYYHSTNNNPSSGTNEAVYQFNGNGWWYRTHEQLRLGINEEGYSAGVGPMGWIRHQNGYFPGYSADQSVFGDRMYGPFNDPVVSSDSATPYRSMAHVPALQLCIPAPAPPHRQNSTDRAAAHSASPCSKSPSSTQSHGIHGRMPKSTLAAW